MDMGFCDLTMDLRIVGEGEPILHIVTDEGGGIEIYQSAGTPPNAEHYIGWAEQLEVIAGRLRNLALETQEDAVLRKLQA